MGSSGEIFSYNTPGCSEMIIGIMSFSINFAQYHSKTYSAPTIRLITGFYTGFLSLDSGYIYNKPKCLKFDLVEVKII